MRWGKFGTIVLAGLAMGMALYIMVFIPAHAAVKDPCSTDPRFSPIDPPARPQNDLERRRVTGKLAD